jgi:hypothetical protein
MTSFWLVSTVGNYLHCYFNIDCRMSIWVHILIPRKMDESYKQFFFR